MATPMSSADTIYALATPPGKSGVAVIRLSGREAKAALAALTGITAPVPRMAYYASFRHPASRNLIDRGLALYFSQPHSFTGEEVVECQLHGGLAVIRETLEALRQLAGLRPAEPGEFTRRAFINGKLDLVEAEGLADLIEADTACQKSQALRQMQGELSGFYHRLREGVVHGLAYLEAFLDFPDEDIPPEALQEAGRVIEGVRATIAAALNDRRRGERIRDGIRVVILGAPNAGKSSLLNALAGRDAAIVSYLPGTTRDPIEAHLDIAGYPVMMTDTAGLHDSKDEIEAEGIKRAIARADAADITLVLFDGQHWPRRDAQSLALMDGRSLTVVSKADLLSERAGEACPDALFVSTVTGEGQEELIKTLENKIILQFSAAEAPLITRDRHRALLADALACLERARLDAPLELACEELRRTALAIGKITGRIQADEVLEVVFKRFCIGK